MTELATDDIAYQMRIAQIAIDALDGDFDEYVAGFEAGRKVGYNEAMRQALTYLRDTGSRPMRRALR